MFYEEYLNNEYIEESLSNYDINYLKNINEDNFKNIYNLFMEYKFDYIEDIILKYLEIFEIEYRIVEKKLNNLIKALGPNYIDIIGEDMTYLEYITKINIGG